MSAHFDPGLFRPALIILAAAAIVIPLFHRLRLSPVLGFMLVGVAVGPFGIATQADKVPLLGEIMLSRPETIAPIAELGISMLMFMIGLELSLERLRVMRRVVFGLGLLQFVLCTVAVTAAAYALGASPALALMAGPALAMSSTAVVIQVLAQEKRLGGPLGRASLGVLLFQDIAAVPVLFVISVLGAEASGEGGDHTWAIGQAVIVVLGLIVAGRFLLRPLFRSVARTDSPELFVAACLLVILATGLATAVVGLPMELGSLIAGLLLAETEFRRQIEVTIEPFKGLLVGVFLISVGMSLDLGHILADAPRLVAGGLMLVLIKLVVIATLVRAFGLSWLTGLQAGLLLGPGGEFGFVILGLARAEHLVEADAARFPLILVAVTMACIPLLSSLGRQIARGAATPPVVDPALLAAVPEDPTPRVIIGGFGRVGETVASMLEEHGVPYVAVDSDPDRVATVRDRRRSVFWGDITRVEMLHRLHIDTARALVVTMSDHAASDRLVAVARKERAGLLIIVRARDARHAAHLYAIGATDAVPETIEASLLLAEAVLVDLGVAMGMVIATIHAKRAEMQAEIKAMVPDAAIRPLGRRRARDMLRRSG
jgi:monovalent cation:H+ antiporter-2, CPA2 family